MADGTLARRLGCLSARCRGDGRVGGRDFICGAARRVLLPAQEEHYPEHDARDREDAPEDTLSKLTRDRSGARVGERPTETEEGGAHG